MGVQGLGRERERARQTDRAGAYTKREKRGEEWGGVGVGGGRERLREPCAATIEQFEIQYDNQDQNLELAFR